LHKICITRVHIFPLCLIFLNSNDGQNRRNRFLPKIDFHKLNITRYLCQYTMFLQTVNWKMFSKYHRYTICFCFFKFYKMADLFKMVHENLFFQSVNWMLLSWFLVRLAKIKCCLVKKIRNCVLRTQLKSTFFSSW
jgi:hypothetical protein